MPKPERSRRTPRGVGLFLLTLIVGGYLFKLYADVDRQHAAVLAQTRAAEQQLEQARQRHAELQAQIEALQTDAGIEKQARERLGLIREGEVPVLVQPSADD